LSSPFSSDFNWKRCAFRSFSVLCLLFIAETVPSFGAILDLVGASTVTLLTFVFPPFFYMRLADASIGHASWPERLFSADSYIVLPFKLLPYRKLPLWERIYCWALIVVGIAGGVLATYIALNNIFTASMTEPCYIMDLSTNITISASH
jgi:vesicular inhibitory amino acid transporter